MDVIIIDSITHEWNWKWGCLEIVDEISQKMKNPNSYTSWGKVTPRHQAFIDSIVQSSAHIITTVRSKQDYIMTEWSDWKKKIEKVWMAQVTRDWFEYELTMSFELTQEHRAFAWKDRTWLYMDKPGFIISNETGKELIEWNESWIDIEVKKKEQFEEYKAILKKTKDLEELMLWFEIIKWDKDFLWKTYLEELISIKDEMKVKLAHKDKNPPSTNPE